jgi:hypothetical protein
MSSVTVLGTRMICALARDGKAIGLGEDGFVVMRANAVEHGMTELVIDDVGREAGVDALAPAVHVLVEVIELQ